MDRYKKRRHSDNYSLGKLAILLIFPWNTAWELLSRPKETTNETDANELISQLLHVSSPNAENVLLKTARFFRGS